MRFSTLLLVTRLPILFSVGCATFGADAEDHVLATDSRAEGITLFEVVDMPTHEGMFIAGGSDIFRGEMHVTGWFAPGDDHDIFDYLSLAFDHDGDTLRPHTLFHSAEAEHVTVRQVFFDVPRDLDVAVHRPEGGLMVENIAGALGVHAASGSVHARNIDGPVTIDGACMVRVEDTGPVDIDVDGSVGGQVAQGGFVSSGWHDIDINVSGRDFERLSLITEEGNVDVRLPAGGFTLDIEGGLTVGESEDDEGIEGHVLINVGDVFVDHDGYLSDVYEVNGGGPLIVVRGAHELEIR